MEGAPSTVRIRVQAAGFWCEGDVVVPKSSTYRSRIHDVLNRAEQFFALTDVTLAEEGEDADGEPTYHDVLILRKGEIKFVVPLD